MIPIMPTESSIDVIAYRGAMVATRDGWIADVKSRGGFVTQVPSGVFQKLDAARFGSGPPFVYELQPLWMIVWQYPDIAADAVNRLFDAQGIAEAADNQRQDVANIGLAVGNVGDAIIKGLPWFVYVATAAVVVYVVVYVYKTVKL